MASATTLQEGDRAFAAASMLHVLVLMTLEMHVLMPLLGLLCQLLLCRKMMWHVCCNCANSAGVTAVVL